ncbi:ATP-binding protein [Paenibacillus gorillae]|uniref:ATP-binding protein n=1 Tax=Paenibacillus gorillae TaxID=1243662 RepID=UPI0004AD37FA|nr:ATP-binding protein [Paenibacillus gorillae]
MLKEMLVQFLISLLPVFAFQLWSNRGKGWNGVPAFLSLFSGVSVMLCMLASYKLNDYEMNFRMIPYLIGSLYGGPYAVLGLSVLYTILRIPTLESATEVVFFVAFMAAYIPAMLFISKPFQRSPRYKKQRIVMVLMTTVLLYFIISIAYHSFEHDIVWTNQVVLSITLSIIGSLASIWISIFVIESLKENQQLQYEVHRVSVNHRREVEKLQQFIDETTFGAIIVNHHGRITHINEMGYRLFHKRANISERKEIVGKYYSAFLHADHQASDIQLLQEALKGTRTSLEPLMEDGRMLVKTAFSIRNLTSGAITGAALIAQDVTELSLLRNEVGRMERLSLVGQMAASITHEIRNPMAVIRGFVQLMKERMPGEQQQYFHIIMEELDRANAIISDFLSLAQNRALAMEMSSLHEIIREMAPLLDADANMRGQSIELELCEYVPPLMLNNKEIKQLLLNLARNGMEAMGDKGVLRMKTEYIQDQDQERIELRIQDQGIGIPQEQMQHLFEPFYTTKSRGTGLGLPLCLSIAERHNGKIEVESKEGEGTTFIVSFNRSA